MNGHLLRVANQPLVVAVALGLVLLVVAFQSTRIWDTRRETARVERETDGLREEIAFLTQQLAEEHAGRGRRVTRGRGPGGIYSPWERYLFHGPTAAQSALDMALAADETWFRQFRYFGEDARVASTFPPASADSVGDEAMEAEHSLPVRERTELVEWPVELYLEADYAALLELMQRMTFSEPGFALRDVELEVFRDGQGRVTDRLTLTAKLSTFWLRGGRS